MGDFRTFGTVSKDSLIDKSIDRIESYNGYWLNLADASRVARGMVMDTRGDLRFGQCLYNVLYLFGQEDMPSKWPALFYWTGEDHLAEAMLFDKFDLIDGFLVPRTI